MNDINSITVDRLLEAFYKNSHNDLRLFLADVKIREKLEKEMKQLQKIDEMLKKGFSNEENELEELISFLENENNRITVFDFKNIIDVLTKSISKFASGIARIVSVQNKREETKEKKALSLLNEAKAKITTIKVKEQDIRVVRHSIAYAVKMVMSALKYEFDLSNLNNIRSNAA